MNPLTRRCAPPSPPRGRGRKLNLPLPSPPWGRGAGVRGSLSLNFAVISKCPTTFADRGNRFFPRQAQDRLRLVRIAVREGLLQPVGGPLRLASFNFHFRVGLDFEPGKLFGGRHQPFLAFHEGSEGLVQSGMIL